MHISIPLLPMLAIISSALAAPTTASSIERRNIFQGLVDAAHRTITGHECIPSADMEIECEGTARFKTCSPFGTYETVKVLPGEICQGNRLVHRPGAKRGKPNGNVVRSTDLQCNYNNGYGFVCDGPRQIRVCGKENRITYVALNNKKCRIFGKVSILSFTGPDE